MSNSTIKSLLISLLLFSVFSDSFAQKIAKEISFKTITQSEGLSSDIVKSIYKDSYGFLWIGTLNGLNRYDTESFTRFTSKVSDSTTLSSGNITSINEDGQGNLWIGTSNGLNFYDRSANTFRRFYHEADNPESLSNNNIKDIYKDKEDVLWVLTQNGLNLVKKINTAYSFESFKVTDDKNAFLDIVEDRNNNLWLGSWEEGLVKFNKTGTSFTQYLPDNNPTIPGDKIEKLIKLSNGHFLLGFADHGLEFFDPTKERIISREKLREHKELFEIEPPIYSIFESPSSIIWIGTANGLFAYDFYERKIIYDSNKERNPLEQRRDQARVVYVDDEGIVWAGVGRTGLNKYASIKDKFSNWEKKLDSKASYRDYISKGHVDDEGNFWFSTSNGLLKCDLNGNIIKRYVNNNSEDNFIKDFLFDKEGYIWIATNNLVQKFNSETGKIEDEMKFETGIIYEIDLSENENIWVTTEKGVILLDAEKLEEVSHPIVKKFNQPLVTRFYKDNDNNYWIAYDNKLWLFNNKTKTFKELSELLSQPLSDYTINDIFQDSHRNMWISTSNGLNRINKNFDEIKYYFKSNGLSGDVVRQVAEDRNQNIWIMTVSGLSKYNYEDQSFINFYKDDGLHPTIHSLKSTEKGDMLLFGEKVFAHFPPNGIKINEKAPPVYLTGLTVNGIDYRLIDEDISNKSLINKDKIKISQNNETIKFNISALNYVSPEKNQYAYKIEDYNNDWVHLGVNNEFTLMNLRPGSYNLRIKGSNNDLVWNEEGLSLELIIKPAWYNSVWAYIIYFLLIALFFIALYKYIIHKEELKRKFEIEKSNALKKYELEKIDFQKEHELDQLKIKFFYEISHEFKTPLTLIFGPISNLTKSLKHNPEYIENLNLIKDNAKRLEELINQLLDIRKLEIGKMKINQETDSFKLFLESLLMSFKEYARSNNVMLEENIQIEDDLFYFDKDKLYKILSNLLFNAVKFTPQNKKVYFNANILFGDEISIIRQRYSENKIKVTKENNLIEHVSSFLNVCIRDEGVGIPDKDILNIFDRYFQVKQKNNVHPNGTGIGLSLVKELIELANGELYVDSDTNGTEFSLLVPAVKSENNIKIDKNEEHKVEELKKEEKNDQLILIAEDNQEISRFLEKTLKPKFQIKKAYNGREGLEKAKKYIPDLIITDLMMPGVDGFDFCKSLKADTELFNIPIVVLTAKDTEESTKSLLAIGVDDYVTKPFNIDLLETRISRLLENRKMLKNKYAQNTHIIDDKDLINRDEEFLRKATAVVEENLANPEFDKSMFAREMGISQSQLYKKLVSLTDLPSNEFVRNIRLNKAAYILGKGTNLQISEVGYMVGFSDPNYFTRKFKQYFGKTPRQYVQENSETAI